MCVNVHTRLCGRRERCLVLNLQGQVRACGPSGTWADACAATGDGWMASAHCISAPTYYQRRAGLHFGYLIYGHLIVELRPH